MLPRMRWVFSLAVFVGVAWLAGHVPSIQDAHWVPLMWLFAYWLGCIEGKQINLESKIDRLLKFLEDKP